MHAVANALLLQARIVMKHIRQYFVLPALNRRLSSILDFVYLDRRMLVHVVKTVIAACMAAGLAMLLELPQPRTAMTTSDQTKANSLLSAFSTIRFAGQRLSA
ncbi:FUSC family protein [Trinickia mobilis]|uniref:FUSC family protein n=1 Tax=Trinickia mobilis TaxID=2816356 RepID=UPI0035ABE5D8